MDLCDLNQIKGLLARHGFRFSKSMGQNFLIQSWVPRDIAAASGAGPGTGVLEVGPGIGPLTVQLARRAGSAFQAAAAAGNGRALVVQYTGRGDLAEHLEEIAGMLTDKGSV